VILQSNVVKGCGPVILEAQARELDVNVGGLVDYFELCAGAGRMIGA